MRREESKDREELRKGERRGEGERTRTKECGVRLRGRERGRRSMESEKTRKRE